MLLRLATDLVFFYIFLIASIICALSAARRLPGKDPANFAADFRWRSVHYKLPSHVWRLSLQWTHCDAHPHLSVH